MSDFECVTGSHGASASLEVLRRSKPSTSARLQITQPSLSPSIQFQPRAWEIWSGTGLQKGTNDNLDSVWCGGVRMMNYYDRIYHLSHLQARIFSSLSLSLSDEIVSSDDLWSLSFSRFCHKPGVIFSIIAGHYLSLQMQKQREKKQTKAYSVPKICLVLKKY